MGVVPVFIAFIVMLSVLLLFHGLSRPRQTRPRSVGDEAEQWLRAHGRHRGPAGGP